MAGPVVGPAPFLSDSGENETVAKTTKPTPIATAPRVAMGNLRILVIEHNAAAGYWGKGKTLADALDKAHKPKYYKAFIVHVDTYVDGITPTLCYPRGFDPIEIIDKAPPKRRQPKGD